MMGSTHSHCFLRFSQGRELWRRDTLWRRAELLERLVELRGASPATEVAAAAGGPAPTAR